MTKPSTVSDQLFLLESCKDFRDQITRICTNEQGWLIGVKIRALIFQKLYIYRVKVHFLVAQVNFILYT